MNDTDLPYQVMAGLRGPDIEGTQHWKSLVTCPLRALVITALRHDQTWCFAEVQEPEEARLLTWFLPQARAFAANHKPEHNHALSHAGEAYRALHKALGPDTVLAKRVQEHLTWLQENQLL